ncbi:MAG: hypothetical protein ACK4Q5_14770 [Saprospiraceae bacterium]
MNKNSWTRFFLFLVVVIVMGGFLFKISPDIEEYFSSAKYHGKWEGEVDSKTPFSIIFKSQNEVVVIFGNETLIGSFQIDDQKNPNWIDIDFSNKSATDVRGIIEMLDNSTIRVQLTGINAPRPKNFNQNEQLVLKKASN